jgi:hypothetical protein
LDAFDRVSTPQFYHLLLGFTTFVEYISLHFKEIASPFRPWWKSVDLLEERSTIEE